MYRTNLNLTKHISFCVYISIPIFIFQSSDRCDYPPECTFCLFGFFAEVLELLVICLLSYFKSAKMGGHGEILPKQIHNFDSTSKLGGQITISFLIVPALFACFLLLLFFLFLKHQKVKITFFFFACLHFLVGVVKTSLMIMRILIQRQISNEAIKIVSFWS